MEWAELPRLPLEAAFKASCDNAGVQLMRSELRRAAVAPRGGGGGGRAAVLALGPLTDVACLLMNHPETAKRIAFIGALISQLADQPMMLNGTKGPKPVRDFNMVGVLTKGRGPGGEMKL